jgi:hypothetical protein
MTGKIFDNEADLLSHLGGKKFVGVMEEVVDRMRHILELLIDWNPNELVMGTN